MTRFAAWPRCDGPVCPRCGSPGRPVPSLDARGRRCPDCPPRAPFAFARSLYVYEGEAREGIRRAKYGGSTTVAGPIADRLLEALRGPWAPLVPPAFRPAVVPVPMRPLKYFRRGYNFPALVGSALARRAGWPFLPHAVRRSAERRPQAGLPLAERIRNVRGAFRPAPGARAPRDVLLVDDVYTSGATVAAVARALKRGGAETIVVVTVARAVP